MAVKNKVLIIEDNFDNMELVRFLLQRADFEVLTAFDGRNGLTTAQQEIPDVILLDLAMPEMDGWETVQELKAETKTANIPVIALTAFTLPGDRQRALDSGCDGYLSKPLDVATFAQDVRKFIR
jgi:two-component system cell cycle response regulator DivK